MTTANVEPREVLIERYIGLYRGLQALTKMYMSLQDGNVNHPELKELDSAINQQEIIVKELETKLGGPHTHMWYPVRFKPDTVGFCLYSRDIPEFNSYGDCIVTGMSAAIDGLSTAFEFYFEDDRAIPEPSTNLKSDEYLVPVSFIDQLLIKEHNRKITENLESFGEDTAVEQQ